jgi:hypothetical protein
MEIHTRSTYAVTNMARRSKSSEILMSGEVADKRQRFNTRDKGLPEGENPEFFKPQEGGNYTKSKGEPEAASQRLRRKPKVIEARHISSQPEVEDKNNAPGSTGQEATASKGQQTDDDLLNGGLSQNEAGDDYAKPEPVAPETKLTEPAQKPAATPKPTNTAANTKPAPAPAPAPKKKKSPSPKQSSKAVAKTMVNSMVGRLQAEIQRKGSLNAEDINALQAEFEAQAGKLGQALEKSFDTFIEAKERAEWGLKRDLPFDRIIVKSFSELFLDEDYSRFDRVSRRMLPGFLMALNMMLGEEAVEQYQERCQLIVEDLRRRMGDDFDWEVVYTQPEAKALLLDAAITIATYFTDYERRSEWFTELINGHLGSLVGAPKQEAGWEMTPAAFKRFLDHLFTDLRAELATDSGKLRITKRHSADTCADIFEILEKIET